MHKFITALLFLTVFVTFAPHSRPMPPVSVSAVEGSFPNVIEIATHDSSQEAATGFGSAVVISRAGFLVTCLHVVQGGESYTAVVDGAELPVTTVAIDEGLDLALVWVDHTFKDAATWGDSDSLRPGDFVFTIGYPYNITELASLGIVSRNHFAPGNGIEGEVIVTDASINPGNSGGGMFDSNGDLVGLPSRSFAPGGMHVGIGLAIPSNTVRAFVKRSLP